MAEGTRSSKKEHGDKGTGKEKQPSSDNNSQIDTKAMLLVEAMSSDKDRAAYPYIDYQTNKITFPVLAKVGESEDNIGFLERLSSENVGLLDKKLFERLLLCPDHPGSYSITLRLYCPKCQSADIEKLYLVEHKVCGYIGKKSEFDASATPPPAKCPSCNYIIKNAGRELRIPGMWYECNSCGTKLDNPVEKLHCRSHRHDFEINQAEMLAVPYFQLREHAANSSAAAGRIRLLSITSIIKKALSSRDFVVEESVQIKGRSGVSHTVSLYAYNRENKTVLVDINSATDASTNVVEDTEMLSSFVKVIDISPSIAILVAVPEISEKARALSTTAYRNISILTGHDIAEIIRSIEQILAKKEGNGVASSGAAPSNANSVRAAARKVGD